MNPSAQGERIAFSRPPELPGVDVMSVEHSARRWSVFHDTYAVVTILDVSGRSIEWLYRRKIHRTEAKNIMLIEPGEVHASVKITPPATFRVLCVDPSLVECGAKELGMTTSHPHLKLVNITVEALAGERTLFLAVTNYLDIATEYEVIVDRNTLPRGWEIIVPRLPPKPKPNRKARLLGVQDNVLEAGETIVQPLQLRVPKNAKPGTRAVIRVNGVLKPLVPGTRVPIGNGYTFYVHVAKRTE
jgi:hypothetical protein